MTMTIYNLAVFDDTNSIYGSWFEWFTNEKQFCFNHVTATVLDKIKKKPTSGRLIFVQKLQFFYVEEGAHFCAQYLGFQWIKWIRFYVNNKLKV